MELLNEEAVDTPVPSEGVSSDTPLATPTHIDDYPESPPGTARSTLSGQVIIV